MTVTMNVLVIAYLLLKAQIDSVRARIDKLGGGEGSKAPMYESLALAGVLVVVEVVRVWLTAA